MRLAIIAAGVLSMGLAEAPPVPEPAPATIQLARSVTCFKTGENSPGGMYKDCYYNCLGSQVTISIAAYKICPITIER